jgi:predicted Zn-dependent protease
VALASALKAKDLAALAALQSPDLVVVRPDGQRWDYTTSLGYSKIAFSLPGVLMHASHTIAHLQSCGDRVTATVLQQYSRRQPLESTRERRFDSVALQRETWLRTPTGWKRQLIDEMSPGVSFVDGVAVEYARPYDPEAPAYDPDGPPRPRSAAEELYALLPRGREAALREFDALRTNPAYYVTELELNAVGHILLDEKRVDDAAAVLELNARLYPRSANVRYGLGDVYAAAGQLSRAADSYESAFALDSTNTRAHALAMKLRRAR